MTTELPAAVPNPLTIVLQGQRSNDSWFKLILVPLLTSILGLVVGGYVTASTNRESAHAAKVLDTQTAAYVDFANAQAKYGWSDALAATVPAIRDADGAPTPAAAPAPAPAPATPLSPSDAVNLSIHEAATRIALFGDVDVVKSIAAFIRHEVAQKNCRVTGDADLEMYVTVRRGFTGHAVSSSTKADIAMILWGCLWSTSANGKAP